MVSVLPSAHVLAAEWAICMLPVRGGVGDEVEVGMPWFRWTGLLNTELHPTRDQKPDNNAQFHVTVPYGGHTERDSSPGSVPIRYRSLHSGRGTRRVSDQGSGQ
jgi:hypothetical protein